MGFEAELVNRVEALAAVVSYLAVRRFAAIPTLTERLVWQHLREFDRKPHHYSIELGSSQEPVRFLYADLPWDSTFFDMKMVRLQAVLFEANVSSATLSKAVRNFVAVLAASNVAHCYCEVAAKDPVLLYALGQAGWSVVESRLHYYHDTLDQLPIARYKVRAALPNDAESLRAVSAANRNRFDRFHADPVFSLGQADRFLGEYAAAATRGFCDVVLVPDERIIDSFLAINHLDNDASLLQTKLGRVVLTAVGLQNRGWHRKLLTETLWYTRERGGEVVFMTTQATNGAVIHNAQQVGFKLGELTHIVSCRPSRGSFITTSIVSV